MRQKTKSRCGLLLSVESKVSVWRGLARFFLSLLSTAQDCVRAWTQNLRFSSDIRKPFATVCMEGWNLHDLVLNDQKNLSARMKSADLSRGLWYSTLRVLPVWIRWKSQWTAVTFACRHFRWGIWRPMMTMVNVTKGIKFNYELHKTDQIGLKSSQSYLSAVIWTDLYSVQTTQIQTWTNPTYLNKLYQSLSLSRLASQD